MRGASRLAALLTAAAALTIDVVALSNISRQGRFLYDTSGTRFYIKGVAYQPQGSVTTSADNPFEEPSTFVDPLADDSGCSRDLPFLQKLGVNVVRVYSVNSSLNHDSCMSALSGAGIYTIIDLSLPLNGSIDRDSPAWSTNLQDQYIETINTFSKYDNVLAYNVGNEVVTASNETDAATFIKAAARDIKAYLASKNSSALVGYAAIDGDDDFVAPLANFLSCDPSGSNSGSTAIDLYGLNNYEWCGNATPSVYADKNALFSNYNVAAYFSEFGCVSSPPRLWTEVAALFSQPMTGEWSGGIAFSYFPAASAAGQFGMVNISSDGTTVTVSNDFNLLQAQYAQASPPNSPSASSTANFPACPTQNSTWLASASLPPTPDDAACSCLDSTFACKFSPPTSNTSTTVGPLLDEACGLLGQAGGNCDAISANGTTGTYGPVSFCDPSTKLSYTFNQFYLATNLQASSCDFAGNATVVSGEPTNSAAASSAASSCLAAVPATFTPSAPATTAGSSSSSSTSGSSSGSSGSGNNNNGALGVFSEHAMVGAFVSALFSVLGGLLVLA